MDELQISGKRYISSRRIAKENGYHTDYIGQLIRANKIKGQKVGRTWYVEAASFASYLGQEPAPELPAVEMVEEPAAEPAQEAARPAPTPVPVSAPAPAVEKNISPAIVPAAAAVAHTTPATLQTEEVPQQTFAISLRKITHAPSGSGLRYIAEEEPLLPEISRSERITRIMPAAESLEAETAPAHAPFAAIEESKSSVWRPVAVLAGMGVAVFIFSALVSSSLLQTINIEAGNPASVGYSITW